MPSERPGLLAVVCDNNGTLLDDLEKVAYPSLVFTFESFGVPVPPLSVFRDKIGSDFAEFYWQHGISRGVSPTEINEYRKRYYGEHGREAVYRTDVEPFLRLCQERGLLLSIVSAEIRELLDAQLNLAGIREYFDDIRAEAWSKKPALVRTLAALSVQAKEVIGPEKAVYIDDTVDGLQAAKDIGMRTIGFANATAYCSEERLRTVKPDALARSFKEAGRIIRSWYRSS